MCKDSGTLINAPALVTDYESALAQEEKVYKWIRKSELTEKKAEADHERDITVKCITDIVHINMRHYNTETRDCAIHVNNLLQAYGSNVTKVDYDAETANIDSLINRLRSPEYLSASATLGLFEWIDQLASQNTRFKTLVDETAQEKIEKPEIAPKKARNQTDHALRQITNRITSLVILNGKTDYAKFITEFNVLVDHYNTLVHEHYGRLHARIDITSSAIATIPEQPYTGQPVFVIPNLTLVVEREGKQVTLHPLFSVDFTIAFRDNVNPGTATLIIKGIGKYKGEITTTFNIVHEL
jgi:hypothetical protein